MAKCELLNMPTGIKLTLIANTKLGVSNGAVLSKHSCGSVMYVLLPNFQAHSLQMFL